MNKVLDADIRLGDGNRHRLYPPTCRAIDGEPLGTGLRAIECLCGWRVTSSERMAMMLALKHLERSEPRP